MGTYNTQADVESVAGANNVAQYADINKTGVAADITTQVTLGSEWAYEEINLYARTAGYYLPLQTPAAVTPTSIRWLAAELCSIWLLEASGPKAVQGQEGHIYWARRLRCYQTLHRLQNGTIKLDAIIG